MPGAERRAQLLDIAREIIRCDGVNALTMEALAEAAGITKPVVYRHFKNSEDVVIEILDEYRLGSIKAAIAVVEGSRTIHEYIDRIIDCLFDYVGENGAIIRSITNGFTSSSSVDAFFLSQQRRTHQVYSDLLLQQGVPEERVPLAAYALMEMINTTINEFAGKTDSAARKTLKDMASATIRSLMHGKGKKPRTPAVLFEELADTRAAAQVGLA